MKSGVDVRQATHVKVGGKIEKIVSKSGIHADGTFAKPSEGGFFVVTETGQRVDMMEAESYLMEDEDKIPNGDFHEVWWIYSPEDQPWAGLRIAHFRKSTNGELLFIIAGEIDPRCIGVRIWVDIWLREKWFKVAQIPIPTASEIKAAFLTKNGKV